MQKKKRVETIFQASSEEELEAWLAAVREGTKYCNSGTRAKVRKLTSEVGAEKAAGACVRCG